MPLRAGSSPETISTNIREFHTGKTYAHTKAKFGKKRADAQAVKVALSTARKHRKRSDGGSDDQRNDVVADGGLSQREQPNIGQPPQGRNGSASNVAEPGLRERAIGTALDWLRSYGHHLGGVNELGFDPTDKEALAGYTEGLKHNPIAAPYYGVKGLIDANMAAVNAEQTPLAGSEEDIYRQQQQTEELEKERSGASLMTAVGLTGGRSPFAKPGELGVFGGKPPPEGKFFHPYDLDPAELKGAKQITPQKGSNPGGTYELPSGEPVYIKTPPTPDHAYNEKLAAELYKLAGVPVADVKMTKFNGKPSIVSPIIPGKTLNSFYNLSDYTNISDLGQHHPADLWLGNYDWVGTGKDNVIVDPTGKAHRIDTGGALRYRAQGALKGPDMWGPEIKPFDLTKSPDMADVMDFTPKKWEQPTAERVAKIGDDQIKGLVDKFGPLAKGEKNKLTNTLIARRDGVAKMYGIGEATPAPPQPPTAGQQFKAAAQADVAKNKQVPFDPIDKVAKEQAQILMEPATGGPEKIAGHLWNYANTVGAAKADAIVKHLPQEMWADIDAHLSSISEQKGHDPWQEFQHDQPDAMWGDDPDHPASEPPMAPEGWGSDHGAYHAHEGDFQFTPEPHWWDDLGKFGTIHTPEKPPGGWTEEALSKAFKDKRFARALTPQEWQSYRPPTTLKKFDIPPQANEAFLQKARALGANTNFMIAKGYHKGYLSGAMETTEHGFEYPKEIENPKSKSHGYAEEHANYFADSPQVANAYGSHLSAPYFMIARKPLEVYYPAIKRANPSKVASHIIGDGAEYSGDTFTKMIHAAHKNGHDWLILHGVNDSGGGNHTQYLMLNHKGTVRGVGADLDPNKKWSPRPLDALVAAPVGYGVYKAMQRRDDD